MRARQGIQRFAAALGTAALGLALAAGCSPKKAVNANSPPSTKLFVKFDTADGLPHDVHHIVHLYWFGSDPDGYVAHYDWRFLFPGGDANPPWSSTQRTDSLFVVPDSTGTVMPTFEVRAVDNMGLVDPNPPRQQFDLRNQAPIVTIVDRPDTTAKNYTFLTQTIDWHGVDPDGDAALLTYRVWLDGHDASPHILQTTEFTFPTSDFVENGQYVTRVRTAYVQAIDAGGFASAIDSVKWTVRAPVSAPGQKAKLLLVDDVPISGQGNTSHDAFWYVGLSTSPSVIARSGLAPGSWSLLKMEPVQNTFARPFRSALDLQQTLALFDAVVWYHGDDFAGDRDTVLFNQIGAVENYLDAGGRFWFEGSYAVAYDKSHNGGMLPFSFIRSHVDADFLFLWFSTDSTANWSISTSYTDDGVVHPSILHSTMLNDSLKMANTALTGVRAFGVRDTNNVVLWARQRTLNPRNDDFDAPVAIHGPNAAAGRVVVSSTPLLRLIGFDSRNTDRFGSAGRVAIGIFRYFGIVP